MVADLIQPGHGTLDHMLLLIGGHDTDGQDNVTVELDIVLVGQVVSESCSVTVLVGVSLLDVEAESFFLCKLSSISANHCQK